MAIQFTNSTFDHIDIATSHRDEILLELIDTATTTATRQLEALAIRLAEALAQEARIEPDPAAAQRYAASAGLLKKSRFPFCFAASDRIGKAFRAEIAALGVAAAHVEQLPSHSLAPDLEVDKKLSLLKEGHAIEALHAERFTALNARLGHLLGRDALSAAESPFRAQVVLDAIHEAWCDFEASKAAHHLVYPLLQSENCADFGAIYQALNTILVKRAVLPNLVVPRAEAAKPAPETNDDPVTSRLRTMFSQDSAPGPVKDRPLGGALPTLFHDDQVQVTAARNELLAHIAAIQRSGAGPIGTPSAEEGATLLSHILSTMPAEARSRENLHTIDLLIRVFDAVFRDAGMPPEMKALIGSLQVPVLKATLKDKEFFFSDDHPARRVIDLLGRLAVGWDRKAGANDPLYQTILRSVKRIQSDQRVGSFADALADLEAWVGREESAEMQALASSVVSIVRQEKTRVALKQAKYEVALRVGTGEVAAFVETFLEEKWVTVLTLAYSVKDEKPQAAGNAVKTMDDLCWSVKPKITMEERKELIARLPAIVENLNKWLDAIRWNEPERVKFFDDLAKCHASIVRAPMELSPERQLKLALSVAQKAAERRLARQAGRPPEPQPDEFDRQVKELGRGAWLQFTGKAGMKVKVRLAWVSPLQSHFIFSTAERVEAISISDDDLAKSLRQGRAAVLSLPGFVGRALAEALHADGDASFNDPAAKAA
ncbi:DUF1631 family protein [Noviherbaspirillum galbum]|uniref:DUF1631 domain-containing protein n=1 Tax=Noviherbaspirillum galbum TaxID=2709383 RepID=A0A6B3SSE0_9BURK|nr:DUF1631 family protein [Noviherbaspirillum galbum]NEX63571.1 DUF1631 domain-containing protein [Noviherbaspirillum galbum]